MRGLRLGLSLGRGQAGTPAPFTVAFTGLSTDSIGTYGQIGNHANISYLVNGESPAFDPASLFGVSDIGGAYDPSDISTLWKDTAGTDPVTADGDAVARMDDISGKGNHLIQATAANRPLYKTSGGLHWLEQQDTSDNLRTSGNVMGAEEGWYCGVGWQIQTGGAINYAMLAASNVGASSTAAGTFGLFERSDVVQRVVGAMRVNAGTSFSTQINSAYTVGGAAFRAEAYHEANTIYAANASTSANAAADDNAADASPAPILLFNNQSVAKFYGGVIIRRVLTSDEKTNVRAWIDARIA